MECSLQSLPIVTGEAPVPGSSVQGRDGPRVPDWLKVKIRKQDLALETRGLLAGFGLNTVCDEARCPNIGECYSHKTATFLLMGPECTRSCGFCAIERWRRHPLDPTEPIRVAQAAQALGLRHVVITSVARDDLPDGGASHFARTIEAVRELLPASTIEVLVPDFKGKDGSIRTVLDAGCDVFNHNVETVPRLYSIVRPQAIYGRSLHVLRRARAMAPSVMTKSGMMVGIGEEMEEIYPVLEDLRAVDCNFVTIGQYLRPTANHLPVSRYVHPTEFEHLRAIGLRMGFKYIASGPFVRSSYNAEEALRATQSAI